MKVARVQYWAGSVVTVALLVAAGCGDDGSTSMQDAAVVRDAGPRADGGDVTPDGGGPDAGEADGGAPDGGPPSDGNDSFDEAIALGADSTAGAIEIPGDADYFSFTATAGEWIAILTTTGDIPDPDGLDLVITLFDESMSQVAQSDDARPRLGPDPEIFHRVASTGTYYVLVQERGDWMGLDPRGSPSFTYAVAVRHLDVETAPGHHVETTDTGADVVTASLLAFLPELGHLLTGTFTGVDDVDVYRIEPAEAGMLTTHFMPTGTDGHGSSAPMGELWVSDASGVILARIDGRDEGFTGVSVPVPAGEVYLWVTHGGSVAGANDFYVIKSFLGPVGNVPETADATNGTLGGAETLTLSPPDFLGAARGFLLATLGDGDVDYFAFDVAAPSSVTIACGGQETGSGVRGLTAELRGAADDVLAAAIQSGAELASIEDHPLASAGRYYLRLSKTGQDPEVVGDFVLCGVHVTATP